MMYQVIKMIMCLTIVLLFSSCDLSARKEALRKKEAQLTEKEQEIALKEKLLTLREEEVLRLKQKLDSVNLKKDTALVYNQQLIGRWNVKMTCTATTCTGSAIGDTKTETWDINYENNLIIAKAMVNDKLVRIYTGNYDGDNLVLSEDVISSPSEHATKITIRLAIVDETTIEGQRIIDRENDCRIIYNLQLKKQLPTSSK